MTKAWRVEAMGVRALTFADTRAKAIENCQSAAGDAGYRVKRKAIRATRWGEYDDMDSTILGNERIGNRCIHPIMLARGHSE